MSDKIPARNDSGWSSPTLCFKDSPSAYDISFYDADKTDKVHDDDDRSTTALNPRKRQSNLDGFPIGLQRRPWLGVRHRMATFLVLAALCIFVHHCFYTFLNGRPVSDGPLSVFREQLHAGMGEQALAITIGNALAVVAKACLSGAVVTAFEQLFWWRLKKGASSLEQIDTMLAFRSNPLDPTSATAWLSFPFLSAITFLAATFVAIPIAAPGALTVNPAAQSTGPCTVSTVDIRHAPLISTDDAVKGSPLTNSPPSAGLSQLVSSVLMAGDYLAPRTPRQSDLSAYNVSFTSPAMACDNVTNSGIDLESYLPYEQVVPGTASTSAYVWNATYLPGDGNYGLNLVVAARSFDAQLLLDFWQSGSSGQFLAAGIEVVSCTPRNATYDVTVQLGGAGSDARVLVRSVTLLPPIQANERYDFLELYTVYDAFARVLNGSIAVVFNENTTNLLPGNTFVAYSALALGATPGGNAWMWRTDLLHALPSLMQNISLSFLSGQLSSPDSRTALVDIPTICVFSGVRFQYNRARLLATYLVAGACAVGAVLLGSLVVGQNGGIGESLAFSRMVGAGMDLRERLAELHGAEGEADVTLKTRVRLEDKAYGSLVPQ